MVIKFYTIHSHFQQIIWLLLPLCGQSSWAHQTNNLPVATRYYSLLQGKLHTHHFTFAVHLSLCSAWGLNENRMKCSQKSDPSMCQPFIKSLPRHFVFTWTSPLSQWGFCDTLTLIIFKSVEILWLGETDGVKWPRYLRLETPEHISASPWKPSRSCSFLNGHN